MSLEADVQKTEKAALKANTQDVISNAPLRVLVVEDDSMMKLLWEHFLARLIPAAQIVWAQTEEAAQKIMGSESQRGFDFIICDVFLSGRKTGVDLWKKYSAQSQKFIFTSVIERKQLMGMLGSQKSAPLFLQKPIDFSDVKKVIAKICEPKN